MYVSDNCDKHAMHYILINQAQEIIIIFILIIIRGKKTGVPWPATWERESCKRDNLFASDSQLSQAKGMSALATESKVTFKSMNKNMHWNILILDKIITWHSKKGCLETKYMKFCQDPSQHLIWRIQIFCQSASSINLPPQLLNYIKICKLMESLWTPLLIHDWTDQSL